MENAFNGHVHKFLDNPFFISFIGMILGCYAGKISPGLRLPSFVESLLQNKILKVFLVVLLLAQNGANVPPHIALISCVAIMITFNIIEEQNNQ